MKIDTHQHSWHYRADEFPWISDNMPALRRDCLPADVTPDMRAAGITGVVAVQARTTPDETDFLLTLADQNPEVLGVVGWADMAAPDLEDRLLQWKRHPAFKGLRHILQDEPDVPAWVNDRAHNAGMRVLQRLGCVYDVLVFEHQLPQVMAFCARHDEHWLVLDHVGKPALRNWRAGDTASSITWARGLAELAAMPHVMCKLSGLVTETGWQAGKGLSSEDRLNIHACFDLALAMFGPGRLMFGSDWPVCLLAAGYGVVHGLVQEWADSRLDATEQAAFWAGNAIRCYGLDLPAA